MSSTGTGAARTPRWCGREVARCLLAAAVLAGAAAGATGPATGSAVFLASRQSASGGFAEQGRAPDGPLTAWAALGLVAAGGSAAERARALEFLRSRTAESRRTPIWHFASSLSSPWERRVDEGLLARLRRHRPGVLVNETIWAVLALRAAGEQPPAALARAILGAQAKGGGFPWSRGGSPDSNDTAAAIQALRAAGVGGAPVRRAVRRSARVPESRRRVLADERPRVRRAVDGLGDPGAAQRGRKAGEGAVPVPLTPAPRRRELPLFGAVRVDAGLGDGAGHAGARRGGRSRCAEGDSLGCLPPGAARMLVR